MFILLFCFFLSKRRRLRLVSKLFKKDKYRIKETSYVPYDYSADRRNYEKKYGKPKVKRANRPEVYY